MGDSPMTPADEERAAVVAMLEARLLRLSDCLRKVNLGSTTEHAACMSGAASECIQILSAVKRGDHRAPATGKEK